MYSKSYFNKILPKLSSWPPKQLVNMPRNKSNRKKCYVHLIKKSAADDEPFLPLNYCALHSPHIIKMKMFWIIDDDYVHYANELGWKKIIKTQWNLRSPGKISLKSRALSKACVWRVYACYFSFWSMRYVWCVSTIQALLKKFSSLRVKVLSCFVYIFFWRIVCMPPIAVLFVA